jgi:oligosaccharide repeat unit polymerase
MINRYGYGYGYQLLGAFLFFVPRSIWASKPLTTGEMFGDFAMNNGPLWFNNVSFALPFEAYYDFWWPGVLLYGAVLGWLVSALERKANQSVEWTLFYIYFAFSCYFVLRGPFLSSYAYVLGAFVAIVLVAPRITKKVPA